MKSKNSQAREAASAMISALRELVRLGRRDDNLCGEAAVKADTAINKLGDLARLFIDGYGSTDSAPSPEAPPTNYQWQSARSKVASRVTQLKRDITDRLDRGKLGTLAGDLQDLVNAHERWVKQLTVRDATR